MSTEATVELVAGWTGPLDFVLEKNGAVQNLTGMTVELVLKSRTGVAVTTTGDTSIVDAANGVVRYEPDDPDLIASLSPLYSHWKVTAAGKVVFFPNTGGDKWVVHQPGAA